MSDIKFNANYYGGNGQSDDRFALLWYARLFKRLISKEATVLDFGAGTGHLAKRLPQPSHAYEINTFALSQIQTNSPSSVSFDNLDFLTNKANHYNGIISIHVFEHLTDSEISSTLKVFNTILKPNGKVLISTPALLGRAHQVKGKNWIGFVDPTHINLKSSSQWIQIFEENDFRVLRKFSDGFYDYPYRHFWSATNLFFAICTVVNLVFAPRFLKVNQGETNIFIIEKSQ